jgi:glycosyltransferase involved in cell wall biosynthesis
MKVQFIIPTYDRVDLLRCMLSSLLAQSNSNWDAKVIIDSHDHYSKITDMIDDCFQSLIPFPMILEERYNDWGHTPREIGKQLSTADYIIMTGDDNYYTPNFVEELVLASKSNPGMIYWDMVHSHYDYQYFKCEPGFNQIDMGAFATRRDLAQQIPLGKEYAADGLFVESFKRMFPNEKIVKINKVLFVHN